MNFNQQLEDIRSNLRKFRFENELNVLYKEDVSVRDQIRISQLESIIDILKPELKEQKKDTFFKEIDKLVFKKLWNRLQPFHRLIKMNEYLEETYRDKPYYDQLCKEFKVLIEEGKLTTKRFVEYDSNNEKITGLPCLVIDATDKIIIKSK